MSMHDVDNNTMWKAKKRVMSFRHRYDNLGKARLLAVHQKNKDLVGLVNKLPLPCHPRGRLYEK